MRGTNRAGGTDRGVTTSTARPKRGKKTNKCAETNKEGEHGTARNPQQTVRRYKKILHQYRREKNLRDTYRAVGVDRNTVVASAPIAELAIVAPQVYSKVLEGYSRQEKLQVFAKKCADVFNNDVQLLNNVEMYKKKNKLLPLMKRKYIFFNVSPAFYCFGL
ncbi:coiled-coil domain-containing protein 106-like [Astyanax mexicanus]|uniref:Coiled-coil domain-containing protein 106-like n=1 Tax=Astyanax mexicanus TaxID=7994 RepID=A0A8T2L8B1_ASTMX|nr:coiled-coil domain-containing protein 106-like [Astyanax mexicanus]